MIGLFIKQNESEKRVFRTGSRKKNIFCPIDEQLLPNEFFFFVSQKEVQKKKYYLNFKNYYSRHWKYFVQAQQ